MVIGFTTTCVSSAYHHYSCELESPALRGVLDATLFLSVTCGGSMVFTGYSGFLHYDIAEILLKVALNAITLTMDWYRHFNKK